MAAFRLRAVAKRDLIQIASYTEERWGKRQRDLYLRQLDAAFQQLAENSAIGRQCDYIRAGYRKFPVSSHVIFYRNAGIELVEIVRILHKRMDVSGPLFKA